MVARMYIAAHPVLRPVKGHQLHVGSLVQDVDGRLHVVVHARGVGNEAHAFAFQALEVLLFEHFNSGLYLDALRVGAQYRQGADGSGYE